MNLYVKLVIQYVVISCVFIIPCFILVVKKKSETCIAKAYEYMVGIKCTSYNEAGLTDTLISAKFGENTKDAKLSLQGPNISVFRAKAVCHVTAEQAYAYKDEYQQDKILLKKKVVVKHIGVQGDCTSFYTESLNYYRKNQNIKTEDFVKIVKNNGDELSGIGLEANLATNKFIIKNSVRTVFRE